MAAGICHIFPVQSMRLSIQRDLTGHQAVTVRLEDLRPALAALVTQHRLIVDVEDPVAEAIGSADDH